MKEDEKHRTQTHKSEKLDKRFTQFRISSDKQTKNCVLTVDFRL